VGSLAPPPSSPRPLPPWPLWPLWPVCPWPALARPGRSTLSLLLWFVGSSGLSVRGLLLPCACGVTRPLLAYLWFTCGLLVVYLWFTCGLLAGRAWLTTALQRNAPALPRPYRTLTAPLPRNAPALPRPYRGLIANFVGSLWGHWVLPLAPSTLDAD